MSIEKEQARKNPQEVDITRPDYVTVKAPLCLRPGWDSHFIFTFFGTYYFRKVSFSYQALIWREGYFLLIKRHTRGIVQSAKLEATGNQNN